MPVLAQRITYVGELGYELYTARRDAVQVWDALMRAAAPEPVGYTALDSLRIEKGYRSFGADLTSLDTPFEAGLGFCVALGKRAELERSPAQRLRTLVVGGENYLTVYGGEAVHANGEVVGRVRSAAYGFTVRRNVRARQAAGGARGGGRGAGRRARRARRLHASLPTRCTTRATSAYVAERRGAPTGAPRRHGSAVGYFPSHLLTFALFCETHFFPALSGFMWSPAIHLATIS